MVEENNDMKKKKTETILHCSQRLLSFDIYAGPRGVQRVT